MPDRSLHDVVEQRLAAAGFVAAAEEAQELVAAAGGDAARLQALLDRRLTGEPLAWITGRTRFGGLEVLIDRGVYVPRWHSEPLALRAAELLPPEGVAVDVCTGSGAIARVLAHHHPGATILATDADLAAVACARANGVDAHHGDLFAPLPAGLAGRVDVVTGVVPYVPRPELGLLQRDTLSFESPLAYDGGPDGTAILRRTIAGAATLLRPGGTLLLELGGDEDALVAETLARHGLSPPLALRDEDGDLRGIETIREPS
jgi:release factor glutamine methyltransferase